MERISLLAEGSEASPRKHIIISVVKIAQKKSYDISLMNLSIRSFPMANKYWNRTRTQTDPS